jgi:hypothetical protein
MFERIDFRGAASTKAAGQTIATPPIHPILAGQVLVPRGVADNAGPGEDQHLVGDERGNVYERAAESQGGGTAAGEGVRVSTFVCNVANEIRANDQGTSVDDPVTLTVPAGVLAKSLALEAFAVAPGCRAQVVGVAVADGSQKQFQVALGDLPIVAEGARLYVLHVGCEGPVGDAAWAVEDPSWPPVIKVHQGTSGGSPRSNVGGNFAYRFGGGPSDTGTSYSGELPVNRDWTAQLIALDEVPT